MKVSIVIPNWNGVELLRKHLGAVVAAAGKAEIIVVDDGSTDGSVAYVTKTFPDIHIVAKDRNEGFASTVNAGVARAPGDIVILLNTDVEPEKGFIAPLLAHFEDESVFAVGCLEKSHEGKGIVLRGRGVAAWKKGFFIHERGEVDASTTAWVSGGSGAFRKSAWQKLGGMDTLFNPFYWEDIDLSYRALKSGYRIVFEPKSVVHHYHEAGKIKTKFSASEVRRIAYRNQFIFIWKNLSDIPLWIAHILYVPVRVLQSFLRGDIAFLAGLVAAHLRLIFIIGKRFTVASLWTRRDTEVPLQ